jgi:ankyrin repeat protein
VSLSLSHILHLLHPTPEEINETNADGDTPLCYALRHPTRAQEIPYSLSDYELLVTAKTLIGMGAPIVSRDRQGSTPLAVATRRGKHDLVNFLLSAGASVHVMDKYDKSVLMFAAEEGYHELVAMLLERGAGVNVVDQYGQTALSRAGVAGHKEVVKLLLAKGAVADGLVDAGSGNGLQDNTVQSTAEGGG